MGRKDGALEQFIQITWLLCGHGLKSKQGKFILDSKMDWQPVEPESASDHWTCNGLGGIFRNPSSNVFQCSEVKMSCLAKVVHVLIEGQHVVDGHS